MENQYALGQVTSVLKEQNLPMLFNEGESSQVPTGTYYDYTQGCWDVGTDVGVLT